MLNLVSTYLSDLETDEGMPILGYMIYAKSYLRIRKLVTRSEEWASQNATRLFATSNCCELNLLTRVGLPV
jgi:hypothetical protein